jgi:hypothetical protein
MALGPDFDPEGVTLQFDTDNGRPIDRLPNPNLTPILIPMQIRAPYFKPNSASKTPFSTREENPVPESDTVESILENLFFSVATFGCHSDTEGLRSALKHERESVVLVVTSRGRFLIIPRQARLQDIISGALWPRPEGARQGLAFDDLRKKPREMSDEIDGIELCLGWNMELYVIPRENVEEL